MAPMATIVTFLVLMAAGWSHCYAAQSSSVADEVAYWKTTLPKTPMPSVIRYLVTSEVQKTFSLKYRTLSHVYNNNCQGKMSSVTLDDPNMAGFFLKKDLRTGTTLTMDLGRTIGNTGFLTREAAASVPFSSSDIPKILDRFHVADPSSLEAMVIQQTLSNCEIQSVQWEIRRCATSLQSMVEFTKSTLGTSDLKVMMTQQSSGVQKERLATQAYTIVSPGPQQVMEAYGARSITCHPLTFPFAVYSCHSLGSTEVYKVPLLGKDGTRVMAIATCHMNTKFWSPDLASFEVLKVKPGTPFCHFIPEDNLVWVRN